ncbi:LuxR C-terminal-related transcriptional regulator [Streptomyces sp. NPDC057382]|uniref:LuxR C-terminal-related transcriptional regulator n=1 Tax=unclassified Streptomyces TaxID=2593676 RepID=UPI00363911C6
MSTVDDIDADSPDPAVPFVGALSHTHTDPLGDPFLRTRFARPAKPSAFLRRQRLVDHLGEALRAPLTLINGPAGSGKTLLATDWADEVGTPLAWLTFDGTDSPPGVFWAYVLQALRAGGAPVSDAVGTPADASHVDHRLLSGLAAELNERDRPVTLVLDDYHRVTDTKIAEQLEFVLHHAGPGLRLVLITRTEPVLPLHRYRAAGVLTEIRSAELAFTPEEAAALLRLHGLDLPVQAARNLVERTRGWAAGLSLSALAAKENHDPELYLKEFEADCSTVGDFLLAEVLNGQTPQTQDFLLRVSILERFCPDLADALTRRVDAEPILASLNGANAFVERLGHSWYQLHPLFRAILRTHLRVRLPGQEPELHRRAAEWLRRHGFLAEALAHSTAAGDWDSAAGALVEDLAIGRLFTGPGADDLTQLFSDMEPEARSPATDLVRAARDLARHDIDHARASLRHAEQHLPDDAAARLSCALLDALAARLTGSPPDVERAAETAAGLKREVPARLLDKHPEFDALLMAHVGSTLLWAGRFEDARAVLTGVAGMAGGVSTASAREEALAHLALLDYLNGWTARAEHKALEAVPDTERPGAPQPSGAAIGRLVLAAVAVDRDELERARDLLDQADHLSRDSRDPVVAAGRALVEARLLLAQGRVRAAVEAADPAVDASVACPWAATHETLVAATAHLTEGRADRAAEELAAVPGDQPVWAVQAATLQLAARGPEAALDLLGTVRTEGRSGPAVTVRAVLVRARAAEAEGDTALARKLVAQALLDARRERLRRPFLDSGAWLRPLLATAPLRDLAAGWLRPVPPLGEKEQAPPLVAVELSAREHDVLARVARMMSTEEIAEDLCLSVNTVKTHLKSIYRKLAVSRRAEAVHRARELRML